MITSKLVATATIFALVTGPCAPSSELQPLSVLFPYRFGSTVLFDDAAAFTDQETKVTRKTLPTAGGYGRRH